MKTPKRLLIGIALVTLVACSGTSSSPAPSQAPTPSASPASTPAPVPSPTPGITPAPSPSPGVASAAELKYILLTQLGRPDWCDPDFYPIARDDEGKVAQQHLAQMQADAQTFAVIASKLGIDPSKLTPAAVLAIYQDWKALGAITLTPSGGVYAFDYVAMQGPDAKQNDVHVAGTIDASKAVTLTTNEPTQRPNCPICLARGTLIDTPSGQVPVELLKAGMRVWSVDGAGRRVDATIALVGSIAVPVTHRVVHLELADARTVDASPGHPLPDGRRIGDLRPGDQVDGSTVVGATLLPYAGGATFDLLPDTVTGDYWANGILLGSTLGP